MFRDEAKKQIESELNRAQGFRTEGFEGRARVCARRAAGAAIREYLTLTHQFDQPVSAFDLIKILPTLPGIPRPAVEAAQNLQTRVDESFQLPEETDLIHQTRLLVAALEQALFQS